MVGLVAGFLASRVLLGHGLGSFLDIVVGVLGALVGGLLVKYLGVQIVVTGHPLASQILVAYIGALLLLALAHLLGLGRRRRGRAV
ncbi:MAG TPA: GlsB/YeaQ/YmgE family stress response membrane protein [Thermomicrobiales bacterium]|nr:GlsB/YeaQ/YmgE family stress response membrane protein [Thermomicrobiales bacterium]